MKKKNSVLLYVFLAVIGLVVLLYALQLNGLFTTKSLGIAPGTIVVPITGEPEPTEQSIQLRTFPFITATPAPTRVPTLHIDNSSTYNSGPGVPPGQTAPPNSPSSPIPVTQPLIGGPAQPGDAFYCIDDVDPDMCDDMSNHHVPKGSAGSQGLCGTIIDQAHKLVQALPQVMKGTRDQLTTTVTNCNYTTGPVTGYISTLFVIDAYNLAGFKELSKANANHVSPSGLLSWWQAQPSGYKFIPYSPTVIQQYGSGQQSLTGCVMFLQAGSGYHVGIVNTLELFTPGGDGVLSLLQSGTSMYVDRFPVSGWNVSNVSTNQTTTSGIVGFGCHV